VLVYYSNNFSLYPFQNFYC